MSCDRGWCHGGIAVSTVGYYSRGSGGIDNTESNFQCLAKQQAACIWRCAMGWWHLEVHEGILSPDCHRPDPFDTMEASSIAFMIVLTEYSGIYVYAGRIIRMIQQTAIMTWSISDTSCRAWWGFRQSGLNYFTLCIVIVSHIAYFISCTMPRWLFQALITWLFAIHLWKCSGWMRLLIMLCVKCFSSNISERQATLLPFVTQIKWEYKEKNAYDCYK